MTGMIFRKKAEAPISFAAARSRRRSGGAAGAGEPVSEPMRAARACASSFARWGPAVFRSDSTIASNSDVSPAASKCGASPLRNEMHWSSSSRSRKWGRNPGTL